MTYPNIGNTRDVLSRDPHRACVGAGAARGEGPAIKKRAAPSAGRCTDGRRGTAPCETGDDDAKKDPRFAV